MEIAQALHALAVAAASLIPVTRIPVSQAQAARDLCFVRRPLGLAGVEAALAADSAGDFWIRVRKDGSSQAWPLSQLESGQRACWGADCYSLSIMQGALIVRPEGGQEGQAAFGLSELASAVLSAAPKARLSDEVVYSAVFEPGPQPSAGAVFWHRDLHGGIWLAYRTPQELSQTTWLVVINGVYFGVRQDGSDLLFERKSSAGFAASLLRERRVPGT